MKNTNCRSIFVSMDKFLKATWLYSFQSTRRDELNRKTTVCLFFTQANAIRNFLTQIIIVDRIYPITRVDSTTGSTLLTKFGNTSNKWKLSMMKQCCLSSQTFSLCDSCKTQLARLILMLFIAIRGANIVLNNVYQQNNCT
jgi:hypothetical protein